MDHEKVDVGGSETLKGVVQGPDDIVIAVQVVPDLGGDEEVLPLDRGVLIQEVLDGSTDFLFIEIVPGTVQVSVAGSKSMEDGFVGLTLASFTGEGTETHSGNGDAVAELEGLSVGHIESYG